jgi:flavin reductase (DIM6/NTAB) family NADH-FMN oxidoreductase RutF
VPRVAECPVSLECRLEWHRPLVEGSADSVFCGRVVHAAIDDRALALDQEERLGSMGLMYNVRSTLNPITAQQGPPGCLASLGRLVRREES